MHASIDCKVAFECISYLQACWKYAMAELSYYHTQIALMHMGGAFAEELGDCTANAKLLQFDRHPTMPVPEPLQLMGSVLNNALDERPFAPL